MSHNEPTSETDQIKKTHNTPQSNWAPLTPPVGDVDFSWMNHKPSPPILFKKKTHTSSMKPMNTIPLPDTVPDIF